MDKGTYMAVNGITEAEFDAIGEALEQKPSTDISPTVLAVMEGLINKAPRRGRRSRIGAARTVPLAYTHR